MARLMAVESGIVSSANSINSTGNAVVSSLLDAKHQPALIRRAARTWKIATHGVTKN